MSGCFGYCISLTDPAWKQEVHRILDKEVDPYEINRILKELEEDIRKEKEKLRKMNDAPNMGT